MLPVEIRILVVASNKEWQASYRARKIESGNSNTYFEFLKTCWVRMDSMEIHCKWNMRIPWNALKHPKRPKKGWKVLERNVFKKLQFRKNSVKTTISKCNLAKNDLNSLPWINREPTHFVDFGGTLYTTKVHFFENVNFSVASLMTILGESTMKQSGNMFLEIKNQERRNKGTSWTFYCHPMNYPSDVDASWEGDTQRILQHGRYLESWNSQALNHIQENPAQPIRSIRFASMEFRNFQESLKFQNRIE